MYKLVSEPVLDCLKRSFNEELSDSLLWYGVKCGTIALDWGADNALAYGPRTSEEFQTSTLTGRLALSISPDGTQYAPEALGVRWSGLVGIRLNFRVEYSFTNGDDTLPADTELFWIAAAIERAVIRIFTARDVKWPQDIGLAGKPSCPEAYEPIEIYDGSAILVSIPMAFHVVQKYD